MNTKLSENFGGGYSHFAVTSGKRTSANQIMPMIDAFGGIISPEEDIQFSEASEIIRNSKTEMELIENSYVYGLLKGRKKSNITSSVPVLNIPMMSDERWNELAAKCKQGGVTA